MRFTTSRETSRRCSRDKAWVARLRANKTGDNPLLLRTNMGAGHGGASGRYDKLKDDAADYAWLLMTLGVGSADAERASDSGHQASGRER